MPRMCCFNASCRPSGFLSWMASWLTFPICPILSAPLAVVSVIRSVRSGSAYAMTRSALLSPFVVVTMCVTVRTAAEYAHGQAVWHEMPRHRAHQASEIASVGWSIDPRTRFKVDTRRPHGHEYFTWRLSNRIGRSLVKMFGPQQGSWRGAIPGRNAAGRALQAGRPAVARDLREVPSLAAAFSFPRGPGGFSSCHPGDVPVSLSWTRGEPGRILRACTMEGVDLVGTGADFFVVLDPVTHREVARYGEPSR